MKTKIHPSYIAMTQQLYCCVPACVQMVLYRRDLPLLEQEDIGVDLGLRIPPEEVNNFRNVPTGRRPPGGWGTRINVKKYSLNTFFKKRNLPLSNTYYSLDDILDVPEFIGDNLSQNNDILICFRYDALYHVDIPYGHASLIEEIDNSTVTLVDPRQGPKRKKVSVDDLIKSIEKHHKGDMQLGGFWLIE